MLEKTVNFLQKYSINADNYLKVSALILIMKK